MVAPYGAAPPPELDAGIAPFAIIYGAPPAAADAGPAKKVTPPKR
jgi:hypothetical protein